jgi:hypothetical protein
VPCIKNPDATNNRKEKKNSSTRNKR